MILRGKDSQAFKHFLQKKAEIAEKVKLRVGSETDKEQQSRIQNLKSNFILFAKHYFPHYVKSEFGWFHKKAIAEILKPNSFTVCEFPREHAKSVLVDIMIPIYLYATGQLTGMILTSATEDKASTLLADIQAEFEANRRFIYDYGECRIQGEWTSGYFAVKGGIGFWSFGSGQDPRGTRKAEKRPNYCVVDDIDTAQRCRNSDLTDRTLNWVLEDLFGCISIKENAHFVVAGNRIHKKSVLAKIVGDIEDGDMIDPSITAHIKVYATENPKNRQKLHIEDGGVPAWIENYTLKQLQDKFATIRRRATKREFYHEVDEEGTTFNTQWVQWKPLQGVQIKKSVCYCDPSWKDKKKSDYKAIALLHLTSAHRYFLESIWIRKTSVVSMVKEHFRLYKIHREGKVKFWIEANAFQDNHIKDFDAEAQTEGFPMPIRADKSRKDNKRERISDLASLYERGLIDHNIAEKNSPDMKILLQMMTDFPFGHDDGLDAIQGAVSKLEKGGNGSFKSHSGSYEFNQKE
jgi:predicted phage terminase large subunit-like protein